VTSIRNPGYGLAQLQVDAKTNARYKDRRSNRHYKLAFVHPYNARRGTDCYRRLENLQIKSLVLTPRINN